MRLQSKNAIVTGGASGIGREICNVFAREGARVVVADINDVGSKETVDAIRDTGGYAIAIHADVSSMESVQNLIDETVKELGGIDIVINNAAVFPMGKVEDVTKTVWEKVFGVNVIGTSNMVAASLPHLKKSKLSNIVNLCSISSFMAQPAQIPYNASKGALLEMTRCLAVDLAEFNIRVNGVCPGYIHTSATERVIVENGLDREAVLKSFGDKSVFKRCGTAEEVANSVLFLASDEASFITGSGLVVDGGASMVL